MESFKAKFPVLQELFAKNHRGALWASPHSGARDNLVAQWLTAPVCLRKLFIVARPNRYGMLKSGGGAKRPFCLPAFLNGGHLGTLPPAIRRH